MMKKMLFLSALLFQLIAVAQSKVVTIVDAVSKETIPYANIKIGNGTTTISNSDGKFSIPTSLEDQNEQIEVSFIGYETQQLKFKTLEQQNFVIKLVPGIYELNTVDVSGEQEDAATIMAKVKANLKENYATETTPTQSTIFIREQYGFNPKQFDVEINESPGLSKSKLKEVNKELSDYITKMKKTPPKEFKDYMGVFSTFSEKKDNKMVRSSKLNVLKATQIKDQSQSTSLDNLEATATNMFLKHLDTTKFYRAKSGWFGSRDTISFSKTFNKNRKKPKKETAEVPSNVIQAKSSITSIQGQTNPMSGSKTDFMRQTDWYTYTLDGATFTEDYKLVYVIKFHPRKGKAKYTGTLYVASEDYAVVKANYTLAKGKTLGGINLKWVLGVKAFDNVSNGTLIYKEHTETKKYYLHYATTESGQYMYVNRPLKFIELTKLDRDVLALDIKVEGNVLDKKEYLNLEQKEITEATFANLKEPNFNYTTLKKYDPKIWREFTTIEPAEEMKQYSIGKE